MKKNFPYTFITISFHGSNISGLDKTKLFSQTILFEYHSFLRNFGNVMTKTRKDQNIFIDHRKTE